MNLPLIASLILLHAAEAAIAAELGRVFNTPEQRKALDAARAAASQPPKPASITTPRKPEQAPLEGYVVRPDGVSVLWVDGHPVRVPPRAIR